MNKISIKFNNCYGIKSLQTEFDFTNSRTYVIYAPNGSMKTSFAKTFRDLSQRIDSKDLIYPERANIREVKDDNNIDLLAESVFVIEPYNEQFNSDKLSTLLIKKELKAEYDGIYKELELEKNQFIKKLKSISQSTDCELEFVSAFSLSESDTFFNILEQILPKLDGKQSKYDFRYNDIFDKKENVKKFLDKYKDLLKLYIQNYESLLSKSEFFKKSDNSFGTYQAGELLKSTSDNSFFEAGHVLMLSDSRKITSTNNLKDIVEKEINKVVNDAKLKVEFDKVDKAIGSNIELRAFKKAIEQNNLLLIELSNYQEFKRKVWIGYLDILISDVNTLMNLYVSKKKQLENIINKAKEGVTDWENSINEFNGRFRGLPFKLSIKNKEDVILKTDTPTVEFVFHDSTEEKIINRNELLEVLSQGERRALYLLNIIFEVQARKKLSQKTLFIIDDIADSFDYKNKYAIIEYLKDISNEQFFYQIILTHNFDFFRTLESRLVSRLNCKMVVKTANNTSIVDVNYLKPFEYFKNNMHRNNGILIASIPFIRNLAEYSGYKTEFKKLTSLLHIKSDTDSITVKDLEIIIKTILVDKDSLKLSDNQKKVIDIIFEQAEVILQDYADDMKLEFKIVLSIAIRLKAEQFLIKIINDQNFINQITRNQTIQLIEKYKELFPLEKDNMIILEQVNLMTPENIHLNSFMYEPLIDLGSDHLKNLYKDICEIFTE